MGSMLVEGNVLISAERPNILENHDIEMMNPDKVTRFHSVPNEKFKAESDVVNYYGYTMGPKIAEGGFSNVFKATQNRIKEEVACKVVDLKKTTSEKGASEVKISDLKNEIAVMNRLHNRYIVKLFSHFIVNSKLYIFMKYANNGTLFDYVQKSGALAEAEARKLFAQLLVGTEHMHDMRVSHRDLKLENILMMKTPSGTHSLTLLISDFGLSTLVSHEGGKCKLSNSFCGTTSYMAPEIILRNPYSPYLADIYSLGVLLYCMINGAFPFDQSDLRVQLKAQLLCEWEWTCHPAPSKALDEYLKGLMEPDVSKRFQLKSAINNEWIASDFHSAKSSQN